MTVPVAANHALLLQIIQQGNEGVPKTADVIKYHLLPMVAYRCRRRYGKYLIESAYAARQSYHDITLQQQEVFAVAEIVARYLYREMRTYMTVLLNLRRNNTYRHAAIAICCLGDTFHKAHIATAKHDGMAVFCTPLSQLSCLLKVNRLYITVGRTEHTYLHLYKSFYICMGKSNTFLFLLLTLQL